ncbi:MAG: hypothetical protein WAM11_00960, partial [Cyanobium sp.]
PGVAVKDSTVHVMDESEYGKSLSVSCFALCPNGNATPDTYRLYESLDAGVIPIAERSWSFDYFSSLFLDCPFPRFCNWIQARRFVENLGPDEVLYLREKIFSWWSAEKQQIPNRLAEFVDVCLRDDLPVLLPMDSVFSRLMYRVSALIYLARMASLRVLLIRARRIAVGLLPVGRSLG